MVRRLGKICLYTLAGLVGLVLLLLLALKLALDRAPAYQEEIEAWVHSQTGYHISFVRVSPSFRWYGPELHFEKLELRSKDGRRVLVRAAGGRVAADLPQLLKTGKLLAGRIELDTPVLTVARLGPTSFAIASEIKLGGGGSLDTLALDDLPAGKLAIRHAALTIQNWNPALPSLSLEDVNIDVRRGDRSLAASMRTRLPRSLGGSLAVSATLRGRGDFEALSWEALIGARDVSFAGWRQLLPEYLGRLEGGVGAFDLAARGVGPHLARADLEFGARGVVTQTAGGTAARLDEIRGALSMAHAGDRWTLAGKHVAAVRGGKHDPDSQFEVSWRGGEEGLVSLEGRASFVRLDDLLPLSGLVPNAAFRDRVHDLAPSGELRDAALRLSRNTVGAPWTFAARVAFHDLGVAPYGRAPGLLGLTGSLSGTEQGGRVVVDSAGARLEWPLQFPQPIALGDLRGTLYWRRSAEGLLIATPQVEARIDGMPARARMAWQQNADDSPPVLTLAATVNDGNAAHAHLYYPRALLKPPALAWLDRAFLAGHVSHTDIVIRGPMRHFPFRDGSGLFLVRFPIEGLILDYAAGWPRAEGVAAQVEFRNEGMDARLSAGVIGGSRLVSGNAHFADFKNGELSVQLTAEGDAADALGFLRATPLDAAAEHAFSEAEAHGPMQADVNLFLPFKDFAHRRSLVHAELQGVALNRAGSALTATDLRGDFDVDGAQVAHADVRGQLLGGGFQMQAHAPRQRPITRTELDFKGSLTGDALHAAAGLPSTVPLGGRTDWRAVLRMAPEPGRERSLKINSSLEGLVMPLPAPLDKAVDAPLPSWVEIQWLPGGGAQGGLSLGSVVSGTYGLAPDRDGMRLSRLALSFGGGDSSSSDAQMLNVGGSVARLDLAGWLKLMPSGKEGGPLSSYLRTAHLNVAELDYLGLAFRDISLQFAVAERALRVSVGGPNASGTLILPSGADAAQPWTLEFEHLKLEVPDSDPVAAPGGTTAGDAAAGIADAAAKGPGDPRGIPSINFHAADLDWGERHFGDVQATLVKRDDGVSLDALNVTGENFVVNAKGEWRGKDEGTARIGGSMTSTDVQATLKELGYAPVLEAKEGRMDFDLSWRGAPSAAALSQATGHLQLALDKGQVVGLNPGAGRVLGLTSVAALRRRLALDFSDLTDKGLAFDTIRGDFDLRDGSAFTDNVLVKGPAAEIGLIGRVGLKNRDYDQTAVVTGNVGNTLPLAALAGGPALAAAVLLFTQVFKQPLKGLARGYYRITGGWDNPVVERIKSAGAASAAAEATK